MAQNIQADLAKNVDALRSVAEELRRIIDSLRRMGEGDAEVLAVFDTISGKLSALAELASVGSVAELASRTQEIETLAEEILLHTEMGERVFSKSAIH